MSAARRCFWKLPGYVLDLAIAHSKLSRANAIFAKLTSLLQELLWPLDDMALLPLLGKRNMAKDSCLDLMMKSPGLLGELSKQDNQMMEDRLCVCVCFA